MLWRRTAGFSPSAAICANTKIKFLKRQLYGRAGFALLQQRILLA
jgi:transposase